MTGYPIILDGSRIRALVVGGGKVAARKLEALLDAGAGVHVVAPSVEQNIRDRASRKELRWTEAQYDATQLAGANLVFAATDSDDVNAAVLRDARANGIPVNVASDSSSGDFYTPAIHRNDALLVAVFASGVPAAAARLRDLFAQQIDARVGAAIGRLARMRREFLERGEVQSWRNAARELVGDDFVASVTNGEFERRAERWR